MAIALDFKKIAERSCKNCHAKNVTSIMLEERPQYEMRVFLAEDQHELWCNNPLGAPHIPMSIGFHNHWGEVSLLRLRGEVYNVSAWFPNPDGAIAIENGGNGFDIVQLMMFGYTWSPALASLDGKQGSGRFTLDSKFELEVGDHTPLHRLDDWKSLGSAEYHSVYAQPHETPVWAVRTTGINYLHDKRCYTNSSKLEQWDVKGYYLPITPEEVEACLDRIGVYNLRELLRA